MKLNELIEVIERELKTVKVDDSRARLSLAFTVKKSSDGEVEVDFVEASSLSRARAEELHRLEVILGKKGAKKTDVPAHRPAETLSPPSTKRSGPTPRPASSDSESPAYFRRFASNS